MHKRSVTSPPAAPGTAALVISPINRAGGVPLWTGTRVIALLFSLCWGAVLVGGVVMKFASGESANDYFRHFTNWNWSLNAAYYVADVASFADPAGRASDALIGGFFWLVFGSNWLVFWLVFVMLGQNPDELLKLTHQGGGAYDAGLVLDMDRVFHVLPAVFSAFYLWLRTPDIRAATSFSGLARWNVTAALVLAGLQVFSGLAFLVAYRLVLDPNEVYGLHLDFATGVFVSLIIILFCVGLPYGLLASSVRRHIQVVVAH